MGSFQWLPIIYKWTAFKEYLDTHKAREECEEGVYLDAKQVILDKRNALETYIKGGIYI